MPREHAELMLRCTSRYRNASLGIFVEPGEVLRELTPDLHDYLLRDSPGSFEPFIDDEGRRATRAELLADDAPSARQMAERERQARETSEHGRVRPMTRAFTAGADATVQLVEAPARGPEAAAPETPAKSKKGGSRAKA